jgi:small subunit ribosomal protein S18
MIRAPREVKMISRDRGSGGSRPSPRPPRGGFHRKRVCRYCTNKELFIDYKDAKLLRPYITEKGKIMPRRITGTCAKHQRVLSSAIKCARNIALLPFAATGI